MLTGGLRPAALSACKAASQVASGPFWLTAPRPTKTLPKGARSTMAAASGGAPHSDGALRAGLQGGEHARLTVGGHDGGTLEARILQEVGHHLGPLLHVAIL